MTLKELKELYKRATPGPWSYDKDEEEIHSDSMQDSCGDPAHIVYSVRGENNAECIVAAVNALPELIERVEKLSEALHAYQCSFCQGYDFNRNCQRTISCKATEQYGPDAPLKGR